MVNFENDAVFLAGKIHGCEWQVYTIYFNPQAADGAGCWEIEVVSAESVLSCYDESMNDVDRFFDLLADCRACYGCYDLDEYIREYDTADFIVGRDGDRRGQMAFLVDWAKSVAATRTA